MALCVYCRFRYYQGDLWAPTTTQNTQQVQITKHSHEKCFIFLLCSHRGVTKLVGGCDRERAKGETEKTALRILGIRGNRPVEPLATAVCEQYTMRSATKGRAERELVEYFKHDNAILTH